MSDELTIAVIMLPLPALWVLAVVDVVRRGDLGTGRTIGWIAVLVLIPLFGLLAYIVLRPPRAVESSRPSGDTSAAEAVVELAERRQRGDVDDETYLSELTVIRGGPAPHR